MEDERNVLKSEKMVGKQNDGKYLVMYDALWLKAPKNRKNDVFADNDADKSSSFAAELSRIVTFMYQYCPDMTDQQAEEFKTLLLATYKRFEINSDTDISRLRVTDFPIFKDLLSTLRSKLYSAFIEDGDDRNKITTKLSQQKIDILETLELYIKNLAEGIYSCIFNGYSSVNISRENFIVFNVQELTNMDEKVYNAQLFNILSYMWQEICKNVKYKESDEQDFSKATELIGDLAKVFTDDPHSAPIWPNSAKSLLAAMILYLLEKGYENKCLDKLNMYSVYNFFLEYGSKNEPVQMGKMIITVNALDKLFNALPVGNPAKLAYATSNFSQGDTRSSIFTTLASNIEIMALDFLPVVGNLRI